MTIEVELLELPVLLDPDPEQNSCFGNRSRNEGDFFFFFTDFTEFVLPIAVAVLLPATTESDSTF